MFTQSDLDRMLKLNPELSVNNPLEPVKRATTPRKTTIAHKPPWTETERKFAQNWLQPKIDNGEYLWFMPQIEIYMVGQKYTVDFVAFTPSGEMHYFEVKGSYKLGSEDRSSVKLRWTLSHLKSLENRAGINRCFWAKKQKNDEWKVREISVKRGAHKITK